MFLGKFLRVKSTAIVIFTLGINPKNMIPVVLQSYFAKNDPQRGMSKIVSFCESYR